MFFHYIFTQAKLSAASLIAPTIQHTNLISVTLIENWNLHTCRHCKTITHAQANDSAKILINSSLWVSLCNMLWHIIVQNLISYIICPFVFNFPNVDQSRENQHYKNTETIF